MEVNEAITERNRYEMEGLNHLRIDEKYDSPSDGNAVLDEYDPFRMQRVYYNGPGQLGQIAQVKVWDYSGQNPTSTDYYYGYDILGNVSVISNSNGAEADQFEQDAFGNEVESSWSSPVGGITEHLTTKQYDADLGLYYFNARWYDSVVGTFISRDPIGVRSYCRTSRILLNGILSSYRFADENPLSFIDPTGTITVKVDASGPWPPGCRVAAGQGASAINSAAGCAVPTCNPGFTTHTCTVHRVYFDSTGICPAGSSACAYIRSCDIYITATGCADWRTGVSTPQCLIAHEASHNMNLCLATMDVFVQDCAGCGGASHPYVKDFPPCDANN